MPTPTIADLRALSDADLIAKHDQEMSSYGLPQDFYLAELARRQSSRRERRMLWLTVANVVLVAFNVALVAYTVLR